MIRRLSQVALGAIGYAGGVGAGYSLYAGELGGAALCFLASAIFFGAAAALNG